MEDDETGPASPDSSSDELGAAEAPQTQSPVVVGIGASAGGLKALRAFFEAVPAGTGMVFVVVVHLSPEHESSLAELLQSVTALPVRQVSARTKMEPDHVYVIPPGKNLQITDGHLILTEFEEPRRKRVPIDVFFRTLAQSHPDGIGIVLSGAGTDGTVGMKAIKERGGLLMAQLPEEAQYEQMPRSVIATGLVDFVLPVRELAEKLVDLRRSGETLVFLQRPELLAEHDDQLVRKLLPQLQARQGHDFSGYRRPMLVRRLARRLRVCGAENLSAYFDYLRGNQAEARALLKDFLISVTTFFRDAEAFEALRAQVIPKLFQDKTRQDELRIWVPGCATGEEAYSIGMLLLEAAGEREASPAIQLFASDLDDEALSYGRKGLYPEAIAADVSEERLKRFFTKEGAYYRVGKELREMVLFASHNLLRDPPFSKLDLITCRNLLIYLQRDLQQQVFNLFHYALRPGGYLFLGSSESAEGGRSLFRTLDKTHRLYERRRPPTGRDEPLPELPLVRTAAQPARLPRPPSEISWPPRVIDGDVHRRALEAHAPPSLVVDAEHNVVHLSETAGRYLQIPGGLPTLSLMKIVPPELRLELRAALFDALEKGEATLTRPIEVAIDGEPRLVQLHVRPVIEEEGPPLALVVFAEGKVPDPAAEAAEAPDPPSKARLRRAKEELETTRQRLQATIEESETQQEELKATNEELQSINEEYKSTLEELETSKEELQSINEELKTVNEELKEKVEALSRANDDLENLMAATDVATIFLSRDFRVKRFTPAVTKVFNVMAVDRGRPLAHLTHQLRYDGLARDAEEVLETLVSVEREVRDEEGRSYLMRLLPYRTMEDHIEGVVLTFVDVTSIKRAQEELRRSEERYRLLIESVTEYAIFMLDKEGLIASWNTGAERLFGYGEEEALGQPVAVIFTEEDRAAGAPQAEMETAEREGQAPDERWHVRKGGARFWGSGILTALYDASGRLQGYAKVLRDNTHRLKAAEALRQSQERLQALNETLEERVVERTAELKQANERVRHLASELVRAEQEERHRIAQVLHDDLQQRLYGMQLKMSLVRHHADREEKEQLLEHVAEMGEWLDEAVERTRHLAVDLSPPILQHEGLKEALLWLATQMKAWHGLEVAVKAAESFQMQDEGLRVLLYQVVRELLFNVVKHAGTDRASVELTREGERLVVRVQDEGCGFDIEEAVTQQNGSEEGFGLFSVRERLRLVGGRLEINPVPGGGTRATVHAPNVFLKPEWHTNEERPQS